jgi:hypothetical protein
MIAQDHTASLERHFILSTIFVCKHGSIRKE